MGNECTMLQSRSGSCCKGGILCFGHPLLDMMATVDEAFLEEFGVAPGSVTLAQPSQMPMLDRIAMQFGDTVEYVPGGAAMNTARALAWVRPDVHVSYVGALGKDQYASILRESLSHVGVRPLFEEHATMPTGTCAGLVVDKERALVANLGAAVTLSKEFIMSSTVQQTVREAALFYAEGFFLNTASNPDGLVSVAHHASESGKTFCLNLNAPYISAAFKDSVDTIMPYIDILFGSAEDIMAYAAACWPKQFGEPTTPSTENHISSSASENNAGHHDEDKEENGMKGSANTDAYDHTLEAVSARSLELERLQAAVAAIVALPTARGRRMVVATRGSESTIIAHGDDICAVDVAPMPKEEIVDLNGAGDAFVGGFLAQYMLTKDVVAAAVVGHATAQNCIRHHGAVVCGVAPTLARPRTTKERSRQRH